MTMIVQTIYGGRQIRYLIGSGYRYTSAGTKNFQQILPATCLIKNLMLYLLSMFVSPLLFNGLHAHSSLCMCGGLNPVKLEGHDEYDGHSLILCSIDRSTICLIRVWYPAVDMVYIKL